ncbi:hypothetical protein [Micromonospora sp. NPDC005189]|uniref:hypothetical protein n=1 Tax=Micromonospora sp. NPDC005189 TaxID=3157019 RepID=UPI0033A5524B
MFKHSTRWMAGLGAAGALVVGSVTPAVAAAAVEIEIEPYFQDSTLAVGAAPTTRALFLYADEPAVLTDVSVRYDYRTLAGKISIAHADNQECAAPEPGVLVCEEPYEVVLYEMAPPASGVYRNATKRVDIAATEDAQLGDSGDVVVSFQAGGGRRGRLPARPTSHHPLRRLTHPPDGAPPVPGQRGAVMVHGGLGVIGGQRHRLGGLPAQQHPAHPGAAPPTRADGPNVAVTLINLSVRLH